jgi:hypothetical protein
VNRVHVYIDGFNLYNRALKNTPFKWLNIEALCEKLLPRPKNDIRLIRYFTARVIASPGDPEQPIRQEIYLRALRTLNTVQIHCGNFMIKASSRVLAEKPINDNGSWNTVMVLLPEEKGSDVNLASYLLYDGFTDQYDTAVIISSDSDYVEPIRIIKNKLGKKIKVFSPSSRLSNDLVQLMKEDLGIIWRGTLLNSQFPNELKDSKGSFSKPRAWK